jgi:hypothetical protein
MSIAADLRWNRKTLRRQLMGRGAVTSACGYLRKRDTGSALAARAGVPK